MDCHTLLIKSQDLWTYRVEMWERCPGHDDPFEKSGGLLMARETKTKLGKGWEYVTGAEGTQESKTSLNFAMEQVLKWKNYF